MVLLRDLIRDQAMVVVDSVDGEWDGMMLRQLDGMDTLFPKAGSKISPCISLRLPSFDIHAEVKSLSLAFSCVCGR